MLCRRQQAGTCPGQRLRSRIAHPLVSKENNGVACLGHQFAGFLRLLGSVLGKSLLPLGSMQHSENGLGFRTVAVAQYLRGMRVEARGARAGNDELRTPCRSLFYTQPPDRGFLMQVRGNHQNAIVRSQGGEIGSHPDTGLLNKITPGHVAVQDSASPEIVHQPPEGEEVFVGSPSPSDPQDCAIRLPQSLGNALESCLPACRHQLATALDQRFLKTILAGRKMMRESPFITNPDIIHGFVLPRHHTFDNFSSLRTGLAPRVEHDVAAHRAMGAN